MESQFETANGLEQFARQSFEFLCWIEDRVVWPLVMSPSLLVGFLTVAADASRSQQRILTAARVTPVHELRNP